MDSQLAFWRTSGLDKKIKLINNKNKNNKSQSVLKKHFWNYVKTWTDQGFQFQKNLNEFHVGAFENGKASEESRRRALRSCFPAGWLGGGGGGGDVSPPTESGAAPQSFQISRVFTWKEAGVWLVLSLPELVIMWWLFAKFSSRFQSLPVPISISSYENDVFLSVPVFAFDRHSGWVWILPTTFFFFQLIFD